MAELEATTVRKGNKKVSVTLSGGVVKSFNWWDDGDIDSAIVGDKGYDLGSRFAITGNATIAPGWSAGFNLTVLAGGDYLLHVGGVVPPTLPTVHGERRHVRIYYVQHALFLHLYQERSLGRPELGSVEPGL